jgi:short subunit dehydrogenase-like uncharacterized protein
MTSDFLLYGSTGFTGNLMARLAVQRGLRPILAGRNAAKIQAQAAELGLEYRIIDLNHAVALDKAVGEVAAVLNCAGPFAYTFKPIVDACLSQACTYLDITGEIQVYEALAGCDSAAKSRGISLLPGVGFDVASSDCLALHLKQRLPSATHLTLAWATKGRSRFSRGSFTTIIEGIQYGCQVRRDGRLQTIPFGSKSRLIDFGYGPAKLRYCPGEMSPWHSTAPASPISKTIWQWGKSWND